MRGHHLNLPPAGEEVRASTGSLAAFSFAVAFVLLMTIGCGGDSAPEHDAMESGGGEQVSAEGFSLSDTARAGERLFNANCSACHGAGAAGSSLGPPLMDRVYHPGHRTIRNAVSQGVRQHHWTIWLPSVETWRRSSASAGDAAPRASSRGMPLRPCVEPEWYWGPKANVQTWSSQA